jgi:hypothetical protein
LELFTGINSLMKQVGRGGGSRSGRDAGALHDFVGEIEIAGGGVGGTLPARPAS